MSKLWTAFQAKYRPSSAYTVSVVLIEPSHPPASPLPALRRGVQDRGVKVVATRLPAIETIGFERGKPGAELGRPITVRGRAFVGDDIELVLRYPKLGDLLPTLNVTSINEQEVTARLPAATVTQGGEAIGQTWPAGFYTGRVRIRRTVDGGEIEVSSNEHPFALLPRIVGDVQPRTAPPGDIAVTLTVEPAIHPQQRVAVIFGDRVIAVPSPTAKTISISATVPAVSLRAEESTRAVPVRVRVDGVDSMPLADLKATDPAGTPATFDPKQIVTVKKP
jgi:hypothetical protein